MKRKVSLTELHVGEERSIRGMSLRPPDGGIAERNDPPQNTALAGATGAATVESHITSVT
jgi:hypothetical protein